jgi:2-enoate reductase
MAKYDETFLKELIEKFPDWFTNEEQFSDASMGKKYFPYQQLFSPIQINSIKIKNRIVMGPIGNISMAEEMGRPASKMIQYFTERAKGGVGLITSGLVPISQNIDPTVTELGDRSYFPRIDSSRTVLSGWRDLAENIHAYGAHFFIQLTPGLGRVGSPESLLKKYKLPVSASWNPNFYLPSVPCRPLTDRECKRIIKAAGQASADAKAVLIDGVYLHGHEGYLLEQMTNPAFNRRKFGRYADWQAFGLDLVREIRKRVGAKYPIMYRIDLSLALNATYGERMNTISTLKNFKNERTIAMTLDYMANLVKAGVDIFDVDLGSYDNWWFPHPPNSMPSGCYLPVSRLVKEFFKEKNILSNVGLPVPIVAVGKLGYPDMAEKALRDGRCDMIMLARPLLADAHWANKAYAGKIEEIRPCIGDQEACINEFVEGGHPQCAVNPRTGFEDVYSAELPPVERAKQIAIVGAGPAGVVAATIAAKRGHKVTLYEKRDRIGGMLVPGSQPRIKYEVANYLKYLENQVEKSVQDGNLTLRFEKDVTASDLKQLGFDAIITCTGGSPIRPKIEGLALPHVVQAIDVLCDPQLAAQAETVVIVGGGAVGCETAHYLAAEYGKKVTLIEMLDSFMIGLCTANRNHMIHELEKMGVPLMNFTRLTSVQTGSVTLDQNISDSIPTPYNTWTPLLPENIQNPLAKPVKQQIIQKVIPADLVVLALGLRPNTDLYEACMRENAAPQVIQIGDAFQIRRVFEAVKAGYALGRTI